MRKFVIIAQPRTGTSMLVNALNALPDFDVYGELFVRVQGMYGIEHPQEVQDQMIKRFIRHSYDLSGKRTVEDFLNKIYGKYKFDSEFNVGFKLLAPHLSRNEGEQIINYIQNKNIYKILLYRENKLKQVISARTNKQEGKIHIESPTFLMTRVKFLINEQKKLEKIFANGKFVKRSYEELTGEQDTKKLDMEWLWDLFGYNWNRQAKLDVPLRKYRPSSIKDNVSNFGTLASHIKNKEPQFLKWIT
jgi:hypothetical protein